MDEHSLDTLAYHSQLEFAAKNKDSVGEANASRNLGRVYQVQGKFNLALQHFNRELALAEAQGDGCAEAIACSNLAGVYQMMGDIDNSQRLSARYISTVEGTGDQRWLASAKSKMADTYEAKGNWTQAMVYHSKAVETAKASGDKVAEAIAAERLQYAEDQAGEAADTAASASAANAFSMLGGVGSSGGSGSEGETSPRPTRNRSLRQRLAPNLKRFTFTDFMSKSSSDTDAGGPAIELDGIGEDAATSGVTYRTSATSPPNSRGKVRKSLNRISTMIRGAASENAHRSTKLNLLELPEEH